MNTRDNAAAAVKDAVTNVDSLLARLNLRTPRSTRRSGGWVVSCPVHAEKTPSCLVNLDQSGRVWAHCYGCGWSSDALGLVAAVLRLDVRSQFREVLQATAEYGGAAHMVEELRTGDAITRPVRPVETVLAPDRPYPSTSEVNALWEASRPVVDDPDAWDYMRRRGLDPDPQNARVIPEHGLPAWASYQGHTWAESGHRVIVRAFDHTGAVRSLRAWQVDGHDGAKRIPPTGYRCTRLAMLDRGAWAGLTAGRLGQLWIVEGEPDWLTVCGLDQGDGSGVLGIVSGTWGSEWAERIPRDCRVLIATHDDAAGDKYASVIGESLMATHAVWRCKWT